MVNYDKLNGLTENLDHENLLCNAVEIDELLKDNMELDDILTENLFVLSFELLDMIKSNPSKYQISNIEDNEKVKALSNIIKKMELYFIEF
ncbi:hypothetical protein BHAMNSH16_05915 [Brachyspira hampsonii]|uniref:Uncharacterized protein n=1 Tax=Brachyspira hampsonii TaxID=1287055 RepID=A0AAC9TUU5_9SPIR|nr:hypothetical protein [Brachyspira hampsonii]ASJ21212.1 hypothetical protein BHAMNSH16_05915 [Brachyspira hampsonii]MBW5380850.1 hypothetical protein [Brachyspira hampsonii]MBW5409409.1 hypothetical protein [Brachyspira hampsonii]OEJ17559.1 hypothetical protein A9496_10880 [Brachyspira hampsonii]